MLSQAVAMALSIPYEKGQQLPSFPCKTCQHALKKMGIVEIENT